MSGRHLLYLIGQPGAGKSTLVAGLTAGLPSTVRSKPFSHTLWDVEPWVVCELGCRRETFSGTDALGMSVQPKAIAFLQDGAFDYVLAEGDRLANTAFLRAAEEAGYNVQVVLLAVSEAIAQHRRAARAAALQSNPQNPTWLKGRVSKVRNLAAAWAPAVLDADQGRASVLAQLVALENPVVTLLTSRG